MLWHKQSELRQLFPTVKLSGRLLWNLLTLLETFVEDLNNNLYCSPTVKLGNNLEFKEFAKNVDMKVFMFNVGSFKQGNDHIQIHAFTLYTQNFFYPPPRKILWCISNIMMHSKKASFTIFQLSHCFTSFITVIHFTLTTQICKKTDFILSNIKNSFTLWEKNMWLFKILRKATLQLWKNIVFVFILISNF